MKNGFVTVGKAVSWLPFRRAPAPLEITHTHSMPPSIPPHTTHPRTHTHPNPPLTVDAVLLHRLHEAVVASLLQAAAPGGQPEAAPRAGRAGGLLHRLRRRQPLLGTCQLAADLQLPSERRPRNGGPGWWREGSRERSWATQHCTLLPDPLPPCNPPPRERPYKHAGQDPMHSASQRTHPLHP
jgi:hypothetical protein